MTQIEFIANTERWMGGTGRRRQKQSVQNTWALCDADNFARTEKIPDTAWWNRSFEQHCKVNDLPFEAHIEHALAEPAARTA